MAKLLLSIMLICALAVGTSSATEFKNQWYWHMEVLDDVFWCDLLCNGLPVDLNAPPPEYNASTDFNLSRRNEIGYQDAWYSYFYNEDPNLTWNEIVFSANIEPPNYSEWDLDERMDAWSLYFNEMYYDGGPEYVLNEQTSDQFWGNLTFRGAPVDINTAPPNYDPEQDYWRDLRSEIGYAWYWEYYICGEIGLTTDEVTDLVWSGIAFNGHDTPPNYKRENDPFYFSRIRRGHLDWWAMYYVSENGTNSCE